MNYGNVSTNVVYCVKQNSGTKQCHGNTPRLECEIKLLKEVITQKQQQNTFHNDVSMYSFVITDFLYLIKMKLHYKQIQFFLWV